jgi:MFS family permease
MTTPHHSPDLQRASADYGSLSRAWWALAVLCIAAILSYTDRQILSLVVDPVRAELGLSDLQIGFLQGTAFAIMYAAFGLPLGQLADRLARRNLIVAGVLLWSAATVACAYARSFEELFAARVAMGIVLGTGIAIGVGGFLLQAAQRGAFAEYPLLASMPAWRAVFVIAGAPGLLIALLLLSVPEPERHERSITTQPPFGEAMRRFLRHSAALRPMFVGAALLAMGDFALFAWSPTILSRSYDLSGADIGVWLGSAAILGGVLGTLAGGVLADIAVKSGGSASRLRLAAAFGVGAIIGGFAGVASTAPVMIVLIFIWVFCSSAAGTIGFTAVQEFMPNEMRGLATSLIGFCNTVIGLGMGPIMVAWFADRIFHERTGLGWSLSLVAVPAGVACCLLMFVCAKKIGIAADAHRAATLAVNRH